MQNAMNLKSFLCTFFAPCQFAVCGASLFVSNSVLVFVFFLLLIRCGYIGLSLTIVYCIDPYKKLAENASNRQ